MIHILIGHMVFFSIMATILSLLSLLDNDRLMGINIDSWYQKFKIIMEHKQIIYVIRDLAPEEHAPNARSPAHVTYQKWHSDCTTMHCIMRAAMNDELSHKFEDARLKKILQVLKESFSTLDNVERHKTSYAIFNA